MSEDYSVRPLAEEDMPEVLDLLKMSLGEGSIPRAREYWDWKHVKNPFGQSPALVAASSRGIAGLRVFMRWQWKSGEQVVHAARAVDTATHPSWRGRGIFTRLTQELAELSRSQGVQFVFNTPNDQSRPGYLKMGWQTVGRISFWFLPRHPVRLVKAAIRQRGEASEPDERTEELGPMPSVGDFLDEEGVAPTLVDEQRCDRRFHTSVSRAYLKWRYCQVPQIQYLASWRLAGASGAGIIFQIRRRGGARELRICEILLATGAGSPSIARRLIRNAVDTTRADYAVAMSAARTRERKVLLSAGFLPSPRLGPIFTVRPLVMNSTLPDPVSRSSWSLAVGDMELF